MLQIENVRNLPDDSQELKYMYGYKAYMDICNAVNIQKEKSQDKQILELRQKARDSELWESNFNQRLEDLENFTYNMYNIVSSDITFPREQEIKVSGEDMGQEKEESMLTNDILEEVKQLYESEDLQDQISYCASITEQTFRLLKIVKKTDENNYRKEALHLFYQAVKRNYAKKVFCKEQVDLLMEMMEKSQTSYIGEEEYFEFDEKLYLNKLEIFPEE